MKQYVELQANILKALENYTDSLLSSGSRYYNEGTHNAYNALLEQFNLLVEKKSEVTSYQVQAITTAYEQGVGKGADFHTNGVVISNPYGTGYRCDEAWMLGYKEGFKQMKRMERLDKN